MDNPRIMAKLSTKKREELPDSAFAFPQKRKEPIENATHVRDAIARFDQVEGVTDQERDKAWGRIKDAAKKFGIHLQEQDWRELFQRNKRTIPKK